MILLSASLGISSATKSNEWISEKEVPQFKCPEGTFLESTNMNEKMYFCCTTKTPSGSSCAQKDGPFSTWGSRESSSGEEQFQKLRSGSFKSNKLDGPYSERHYETGKVVVEGTFSSGFPTGKWVQRDKEGSILVEAIYTGNTLTEISIIDSETKGTQKLTDIQEPEKAYSNPNTVQLGVVYPGQSSILYSKWSTDRKVIGFSSGKMRFYSSAICLQYCDPAHDGSVWNVVEKIRDMCKVIVNPNEYGEGEKNYFAWVNCKGQFKHTLDIYKKGMSYIESNAILYERPGGKRKSMSYEKDHLKRLNNYLYPEHSSAKQKKGSPEEFEGNALKIQNSMNDWETRNHIYESYNVNIIDSKIFNGEIWVEVELTDPCGEGSKYQGRGWLPFYLNGRPQLGMYQSC